MFQVRNGSHTLTWDDGVITGPTDAVVTLAAHAAGLEGYPVGFPTGPATTNNHLADPLSALWLMLDQLGPEAEATGDVPEMDDIPEGAVA